MTPTPDNIKNTKNCVKQLMAMGFSHDYAAATLQGWWNNTGKVPVVIHPMGSPIGTARFGTKVALR